LYSNARIEKLLTSGSVDASVIQAQIHVIKYMANFVIFLAGSLIGGRQAVDEGREGREKKLKI
jgi:hypothetical protein